MSDLNLNSNNALSFVYSHHFPKSPNTKHMSGCRCHAYCNLPRLPLELWLRILKIKRWTERKLTLKTLLENREKRSQLIRYGLVNSYRTDGTDEYIYVFSYGLRNVDYYFCCHNFQLTPDSKHEIIEDITGIEDPVNDGNWYYCPILDFAYWSFKWDSINFYFNKDW